MYSKIKYFRLFFIYSGFLQLAKKFENKNRDIYSLKMLQFFQLKREFCFIYYFESKWDEIFKL